MKHLWWVICMVVLLTGCSPSIIVKSNDFDSTHAYGTQNIIVDGITYHTVGGHGQKDGVLYSLILAFPEGQHYFPVARWSDESSEPQGQIYVQKEGIVPNERHETERITWAWAFGDKEPGRGEKIADVVFNYVYFIDNEQVVFQASNEELGIDLDHNMDHIAAIRSQQQLEPILKKLIRENVTPHEEKE